MNSYGVSNIFELLNDLDKPAKKAPKKEQPKKEQPKKEQPKKEQPKEQAKKEQPKKEQVKEVAKVAEQPKDQPKETSNEQVKKEQPREHTEGQRGGRGGSRGGRGGRNPNFRNNQNSEHQNTDSSVSENAGEKKSDDTSRPPRSQGFNRGGRGGFREGAFRDGGRGQPRREASETGTVAASDAVNPQQTDRPFRHERRERREGEGQGRRERFSEEKGFVQTKQRTFERRSGTGRAPNENKKHGAGARSWGVPGSEKDVQVEETEVAEAQPEVKDSVATESKTTEETKTETTEKTDEKPTFTLKEYQKTVEMAKISLPKRRVAGEGQEEDWSKFTPLQRESEDKKKKVEQKVKPVAAKSQPKKKNKVVPLDQVLHVDVSSNGDRERDQRRNNRRERPAQKKNSEIVVASEDFPALSPAKVEATKA